MQLTRVQLHLLEFGDHVVARHRFAQTPVQVQTRVQLTRVQLHFLEFGVHFVARHQFAQTPVQMQLHFLVRGDVVPVTDAELEGWQSPSASSAAIVPVTDAELERPDVGEP